MQLVNKITSGFDQESFTSVSLPAIGTPTRVAGNSHIISVIVPALQEEKIIECLLSIFTPEFKLKHNIELIVSDGGSTDKTIEIAERYADIVVRHVSGSRQNISKGRNVGANAAHGEAFVFINADTVPASPDQLFEFVQAWSHRTGELTDFDALACNITAFPDEMLLKDKIFYKLHNSYVRLLNAIGLGMGRGECQIVRRDTFKIVHGYNETIAAGEDFDLYRRIARIARIGFAKNLVVYESPRRFRKYGYLRTISCWILNSIFVWIAERSVSKQWEPVR